MTEPFPPMITETIEIEPGDVRPFVHVDYARLLDLYIADEIPDAHLWSLGTGDWHNVVDTAVERLQRAEARVAQLERMLGEWGT